jgi:integrase|tara:strand:+ start:4827 stop:6242 length:1416 start_codon:yes stop_codon:yes gene_type:complete
MVRPIETREQRLATLLEGFQHVPAIVQDRLSTAFLEADLTPRGMPKALTRFYAHLETAGRTPEQVATEDFETLSSSRTAHRTLLTALRKFAPEVPLAAARPITQHWDHWLNSRYNQKPKRPRKSIRVAHAPEDWPEVWQSVMPALDRVVRVNGRRFRKLAFKTRNSVIQAIGMLAAARIWAQKRGVDLDASCSAELFEAFTRFMLLEREASARTAADYLERIRMFAARGGLLPVPASIAISELIGALRDEAAEEEPTKRAKVRNFRERFTLADVLTRALSLSVEADMASNGSAEAERKRRIALILALLVNTGDRQGDLSRFAIGQHVTRAEGGLWAIRACQAKTGRMKDLGALWPLTSALIDAHILAGRPSWQIEDQVRVFTGRNLLSLSAEPFHRYYSTQVLREEFGISGHLVRTLITDLLRNQRPDADWAAQEMLGHSNKWMQVAYQSDFCATASIQQWHRLLQTFDMK